MEKISWKVSGMSCTNCALTVDKYLRNQGMQDIKVNFIGGDVSFENAANLPTQEIAKGIEGLGYHIETGEASPSRQNRRIFKNHLQRFLFCFVFTAPLMLHMVPGVHIHVLMNPYFQLALTAPVFIAGMSYFGKSAINSVVKGVPNMNVLVALGAVAAFIYSLYGTLRADASLYMFYETTATIITLVFLGNWLEERSVKSTQSALEKLAVSQVPMANMIAYDEHHNEHVFPVESKTLKVGDLLLVNNGETVPMDSKILWGEAGVNESIITGESAPVEKKMGDKLIGGSILETGTLKVQVTAVGEDTVLAGILQMVRNAQGEKPPVQRLADKISAIFVPAVICIALLTLLLNYFAAQQSFETSVLRAIAVLVISCPCAMGLATPAAIAVGLGRAARNGVLFKNAKSLESFRHIQQVVFDKTGTLTTGAFTIAAFQVTGSGDAEEFKRIVYSLEKYSSHPIAKAIVKEWKIKNDIRWSKIEEVKGLGMQGTDKEGNTFTAGSFKTAATLTGDTSHAIYVTRNHVLLGTIDVEDEIRAEAKAVVHLLKQKNIKTILLSGDRKEKCEQVAAACEIDEVYAEQSPRQKLDTIALLNQQTPTAMVGDGINDAPALAKATLGISLSEASQIAVQSAQVILMNQGLKQLPLSLGLGKHTYLTIKQNLFWAFAYNIVAIPVAALGFLNPTFSALSMGLSDVVLGINSVRLNFKKII